MISNLSRRSFLAATAAAPLARVGAQGKRLPVGIELYSVRDELAKDNDATLTAIAKMGYEVVEFYSPYYQWTAERAKQIRKLMDDLGIRCNSTHNDARNLTAEGLPKAIARDKRARREKQCERALSDFGNWLSAIKDRKSVV